MKSLRVYASSGGISFVISWDLKVHLGKELYFNSKFLMTKYGMQRKLTLFSDSTSVTSLLSWPPISAGGATPHLPVRTNK